MDFITAKTELLDFAGRSINNPTVSRLAGVSVNRAVLEMQRRHTFNALDTLTTLTYPAKTLHISISDSCGDDVWSIKSVQLLGGITDTEGQPLRHRSYDSLLKDRREQFYRFRAGPDILSSTEAHTQELLSQTSTFKYFTQGDAAFGLYPTPGGPVPLLVNYNLKLPDLVSDADTNVFLSKCSDYVGLKALQIFDHYLQKNEKIGVDTALMKDSWTSVLQWDDEVSTQSEITIG